MLTEVVDLAEQLAITVTRQAVLGAQQGMPHRKDDERPLPFNESVSTYEAEDLRATLVGWVRDIEPDIAHQPHDDLVSIATWLTRNVETIRQHQAADEIYDEIRYAVREAWRAVDRPAHRSRVVVGDCIVVSCPGTLIAYFPTAKYDENDETTHSRMVCDTCEVTYGAAQWINVGREILRRVG
jgi:hypothetical protein